VLGLYSLLISNVDFIVTMDRGLLRKSSIYVINGEVVGLGSKAELLKEFGEPEDELSGEGKVAIPGLIDSHTHLVLTALKGLASDSKDVIYSLYWPVERSLSKELVFKLARLGALEAVMGGVTLVNEHYFFAEEIARAIESVGLRGLVGHAVMTWGGPWVGEDELKEAVSFVRRWLGKSELITPTLAPHSPETVSTSWLEYLRDLSREYGVLIHMHLAQTEREVKLVKERTGYTPVRLVHKLGLLSNRTVVTHCVFIDSDELRLLVNSGAIVAQTPSTYLLDGTPYHALSIIKYGGKVVLGTDAPCYSDGIDMFREMRNLIYSQRLLNRDPTALNAEEVLKIATIRAANYLGLRGLGIIKEGYRADMVLISLKHPRMIPVNNVYATVVYATTSSDVTDVIINGEVIVRDGKYVRGDAETIIKEGNEAAKELLMRAGVAHTD